MMKSCLDIPYYLDEDRCFYTGFLPMDSLPHARMCCIRWFHQKQTFILLLRVVMGIKCTQTYFLNQPIASQTLKHRFQSNFAKIDVIKLSCLNVILQLRTNRLYFLFDNPRAFYLLFYLKHLPQLQKNNDIFCILVILRLS